MLSRRDLLAATAAALASGIVGRRRRAAGPRLIVRADDMGYAHAGNEAILRCARDGIATSVEVLAPSPWFPEAARLLAANPQIDAGVHLALTSEWDLVKWRPLSVAPSLRDDDGYFYPMIAANANYPGRALSQHAWRIDDVEREFRAQIELAKKHVPQLSHWSAHMGCTSLAPDVTALARALGEEYGIDIVPEQHGVKSVTYAGVHATSAEKQLSFIAMLDRLEDGQTYLMVDHPGLDGPELRGIHHIGYEQVAADRQGVTDLFTDSQVRAHIKERGVRLISYRDLR